MDRTERVSLLLTVGDSDEILARLRSDYAGAYEQHKHLLPVEEQRGVQAKAPSLPPVTVARPMLPRVHRESAERPTLTVLVDKSSLGQLTIRYSLPDDDQAVQVGPIDWESLWSKTTLAGKTGLPALRYALSNAKEIELWSWLPSIGDILFQILFPVREVQDRLLARLFRNPHPSPSRDRLRVRILTTDPELRRCSWAPTSVGPSTAGEPGWSFELVTQDLPEKRAVLQSPVRVLVIAPDTQAAEERDNHLTDLKTLLGHPEPEFFQVVKSRRDLWLGRRRFRADVVYFLGAGQCKRTGSH